MRIGYVLKKFPRLSETFILNEILGLEELGHEVRVYTLRPADDEPRHADFDRVDAAIELLETAEVGADELECARPLVVLLPTEPSKIRRRVLAQGARLAQLAKRDGIDHLHAHFMTGAAQVSAVAHLLGGPDFTVTCHAKDIFRGDIDAALFRRLTEISSGLVTVSDFNRRFIAQRFLGGDDAAITRVYNGLPLDEATFRIACEERDPDLILGVGRLVAKKGFDVLLRAAAELRERGSRPRIVLVGDGEESDTLRAQSVRLGLQDQVEFLGSRSREDVLALMRRAALFVLPCREGDDGNRDALPTVLIEAMALGCPTISTQLVGIPEIIEHESEGLLVPAEDVDGLRGAIARLLGDPELRRSMSRAGPRKARARFDRFTTLPELVTVFRRVSTRPAARRSDLG